MAAPPIQWPCRFETDSIHFERPPAAFLVRKGTARSFQVLINERVLAELCAHCRQPQSGEAARDSAGGASSAMGLLLGEFCEDPEGQFVVVEGLLRASDDAPAGNLASALASQKGRLEEQRHERFPKLRLLGWYRGHPGQGVSLSVEEREFHARSFAQDFQFALVHDPDLLDGAVFTWNGPPDEGVSALSSRRGFYLYHPSPRLRRLVPDSAGLDTTSGDPVSTCPTTFSTVIKADDGVTWEYLVRGQARAEPPSADAASSTRVDEPEQPPEPALADRLDDQRDALLALQKCLGSDYDVDIISDDDDLRASVSLPLLAQADERLKRIQILIPPGFPAEPPVCRFGDTDYPVKNWQACQRGSPAETGQLLANVIVKLQAGFSKKPQGDPRAEGSELDT